MFYAILGIVVVVALILIFRDDHDKSYNKNEKKDNRKETSQPKAEFSFEHKAKDGTGHKAEFQDEAKKVIGMIGSIIEEVKKEAAEPLQDIQKGVQGVLDEAKVAIDKAMKEAGQKPYWTCSTARLIAEIKVIIPVSQEYVEEEIEDGV